MTKKPPIPAPVQRLVGQNLDDLPMYVDAFHNAQEAVISLARLVSVNSQPSAANLTALRHAIKAYDDADRNYQGFLDGSFSILPNVKVHRAGY